MLARFRLSSHSLSRAYAARFPYSSPNCCWRTRSHLDRDCYRVRSTILTSQLPVSRWHEQLGDPTLADGILDRLVHYAHRIEMRGDSMRKNRGKPNA